MARRVSPTAVGLRLVLVTSAATLIPLAHLFASMFLPLFVLRFSIEKVLVPLGLLQ